MANLWRYDKAASEAAGTDIWVRVSEDNPLPISRDGGTSLILKESKTNISLIDNAYILQGEDTRNAAFVKNDGTSDLTFTIGTITTTLKPGETDYDEYEPFSTITFSAGAVCRFKLYKEV